MRGLVANIPLPRNRFLADLNAALGKRLEVVQSSDDFWNMTGDYDVVHLHWPEYITYEIEKAYNTTLDQGLIASLEKRLSFWASRAAIVITRHNPFPYHAAGDPDWTRVYELVYSYADGVVHLGQASVDEFRQHEGMIRHHRGHALKHAIIPIHNYLSLPNNIGREAARRSLGIDQAAAVILVFGAIRSDAERKLILDSFDLVSTRNKHLLVSSWREHNSGRLSHRASSLVAGATRLFYRLHPRFSFNYGFVAESDAQIFLNAADVLLIPRLHVLNSANVSLGMTFSRIVAGPDLGNVGELLREAGNPVFDPRDTRDVATAVENGLRLSRDGITGRRNREIAVSEWDVDRCAEKYAQFFHEVADRTPATL